MTNSQARALAEIIASSTEMICRHLSQIMSNQNTADQRVTSIVVELKEHGLDRNSIERLFPG